MKSVITFLSGCCLITLLSGCSSIMCGPTQKVSIMSRPPGAEVLVYNSHAEVILKTTTPCIAKLARRSPDYVAGAKYAIVIKKEGYDDVLLPLVGNVNRAYFANIMNGGLGYAIDPMTGSMWTLTPEGANPEVIGDHTPFFSSEHSLMVTMKEEAPKGLVSASPPAVEK